MEMKYRIKKKRTIDDDLYDVEYYVVQVHRWFGWVDIKKFQSIDDDAYARQCATELWVKLNEEM